MAHHYFSLGLILAVFASQALCFFEDFGFNPYDSEYASYGNIEDQVMKSFNSMPKRMKENKDKMPMKYEHVRQRKGPGYQQYDMYRYREYDSTKPQAGKGYGDNKKTNNYYNNKDNYDTAYRQKTDFIEFDGYKASGGQVTPGIKLEGFCKVHCKTNPACMGYTFNRSYRSCVQHIAAENVCKTTWTPDVNVVSAFRVPCFLTSYGKQQVRTGVRINSYRRNSVTKLQYGVRDYHSCISTCTHSPECRMSEFDFQTRQCHFITVDSECGATDFQTCSTCVLTGSSCSP